MKLFTGVPFCCLLVTVSKSISSYAPCGKLAKSFDPVYFGFFLTEMVAIIEKKNNSKKQ